MRIDKRLLNTVTGIKADFKDGKSLDDITSPKNDDAKLLKKIAALNNKNQHLCDCLENEKQARIREVNGLRNMIKSLNESIDTLIMNEASSKQTGGNFDKKLRKRLIQYCHPDGVQDARKKAIAEELTKELNAL